MALSAKIVQTVNPDLLDINFGCPVKKVVTKGAGAGVLKDVDLMERLTKAVVQSTSLPVTVKTRLGWDDNSINIVEVAERMQDCGVQAISIHARTRCQLYKGQADWSWIAKVKENPRLRIPVFGNGDIDSPEKALEYRDRYGTDGIMIGRAAIGYPWVFREVRHFLETGNHLPPPTLEERIEVIRTHLLKSVEWKGNIAGINEMRRHYANYLKGLPNIKDFRLQLVTLKSVEEIGSVLDVIQSTYQGFQFEPRKVEIFQHAWGCSQL
jgi:nifR3 family TIM-barrel protein